MIMKKHIMSYAVSLIFAMMAMVSYGQHRYPLSSTAELKDSIDVLHNEIRDTTASLRSYINLRSPFLSNLGWFRNGGQVKFNTGTGRTIRVEDITFSKWDNVRHASDVETINARDPLVFDVYTRNGLSSNDETVIPNQMDIANIASAIPTGDEKGRKYMQLKKYY